MKIRQEKSQVVATEPPAELHTWTTPRRHTNETSDTTEYLSIPDMTHSAAAPTTMQMPHNNEMPVGYDGSSDNGDNTGRMPLSIAGATDATNSITEKNMRQGYISYDMPPNDGEERGDFLYDDVGGFVERGNYCDRN